MPHPSTPSSFGAAKKTAMKLYAAHERTCDCDCDCDCDDGKRLDPQRCGYQRRNDNERARRMEWEHVVPAAAFGSHRPCWTVPLCEKEDGARFKGRRCCRAIDPVFRTMEADLQNLVPAVGELNGDRSNRKYGEVAGEPRAYGACDFEVDFDADVAEPAEGLRGDVARIYLYMHFAYNGELPLSDADLERFVRWHGDDPPDDWEKERDALVVSGQGPRNPLFGDRQQRDSRSERVVRPRLVLCRPVVSEELGSDVTGVHRGLPGSAFSEREAFATMDACKNVKLLAATKESLDDRSRSDEELAICGSRAVVIGQKEHSVGSMIHLRCGSLEIDWGKNSGFSDHRSLFQPSDVATWNYQYADDVVEEQEALVRPLRLVLPRLRLLGVTAEVAAEACVARMPDEDLSDVVDTPKAEEIRCVFDTLRIEDLANCRSLEHLMLDASPINIDPAAVESDEVRTRVEEALKYVDPWGLLCLLGLNTANVDAPVAWEYADVRDGGWVSEEWLRPVLPAESQFLIVGEGSSDTNILRKAFVLLRPEIADFFFFFVDMDAGYPFSGTGNTFRFCQGLVSMRLLNKVLFVLDNDAEGVATYNRITALSLPRNISAIVLPSLSDFERFKTVGPSGAQVEDINGKAVSIECFLDLRCGQDHEPTVRWTNHLPASNAYQGSLDGKDQYSKAFLKCAAKERRANYDFRKLEALLDSVVTECARIADQTAEI